MIGFSCLYTVYRKSDPPLHVFIISNMPKGYVQNVLDECAQMRAERRGSHRLTVSSMNFSLFADSLLPLAATIPSDGTV